jgi:hypothetical protein
MEKDSRKSGFEIIIMQYQLIYYSIKNPVHMQLMQNERDLLVGLRYSSKKDFVLFSC